MESVKKKMERYGPLTRGLNGYVAAGCAPEDLVRSLKSWTTRRLVQAGALPPTTRLWSRHASTVYLWTVRSRDQAVRYVVYGQDVDPGAI